MKHDSHTNALMTERFGRDSLIALATTDGMTPSVRAVNACYEDGSFYLITHARSGKMRHIAANPTAGLCGEWFTAHAKAESLGHILLPENAVMADKLRRAFAEWYGNGHINEADPSTIILRLRLLDGVLFWHGTRYDIEF